MLADPPCLASAQAFGNAGPAELAAACVLLAFHDGLDAVQPICGERELLSRIVQRFDLLPYKVDSLKWFAALDGDELKPLRAVMYEGMLFAEQRLLVWRRPVHDGTSEYQVEMLLLRRGRALLTSGDVAAYLG